MNTLTLTVSLSVLMYSAGVLSMMFGAFFPALTSIGFGIVFYLGSLIDIYRFTIKVNLVEAILLAISSIVTLVILTIIGFIACCFDGF